MIRMIALTLFTVMLGSCATSYQKQGFTGGFSETQLAENVFQVTFKGNAYTSEDRAADFTLLRSAELALEHGYRYFVIVESAEYAKQEIYTTPTTTNTNASVYGVGNTAYGNATSTTTGGQSFIYSKPRRSNTIVCFSDKPDAQGIVYEANFVAASIRSKYSLGE